MGWQDRSCSSLPLQVGARKWILQVGGIGLGFGGVQCLLRFTAQFVNSVGTCV